jgi:hypothetical protein
VDITVGVMVTFIEDRIIMEVGEDMVTVTLTGEHGDIVLGEDILITTLFFGDKW